MSRPAPKDAKLIRPAQQPGAHSQSSPPGGLLEAYKKHAEELRGIEDRQNKTIALLLGIFSAAATLLIRELHLDWTLNVYVTLVSLMLLYFGQHAINELHDLRIAARDLLVRCETGLRFYESGAFLDEEMLYTPNEQEYPTKGGWMKGQYWIVWLVGVVFLVLLWLPKR